MASRGTIVSLVFLTLAAIHTARAQRVRGTVRDSSTGEPISGAVVWVTDSAGNFLARSIGDEAGLFSVPRLRGAAGLHLVRIGYHPRELSLENKSVDSSITVRMAALPLSLGPVAASSRRVCPGEKGTSSALVLWEQARAALLASVVAREAAPPRVRVLSYSRTMEPTAHRVTNQAVHARNVIADRSYVAARPAWVFAEEGYMHQERGGDRTFYAPDDAVMLDATFAGTHCLRVVAGRGPHEADVGIGFEPVRDNGRDTLVDVSGVLWIERRTATLRSLDFHYTGLEPAAIKESGGEIVFRVMPNGAPMIERWNIRTASLTADVPLHPSVIRRRIDRSQRTDVTVTGFQEFGGAIASADWPDGTRWRAASLRRVTGQLMQLDGKPPANARVWLSNGPDTTTSDANGFFTISDVLPGHYSVMAADSTLASVGMTRAWAAVDVSETDSRELFLFYFGVLDVVSSHCKQVSIEPGTGVLLGRMMDSTGAPTPGAHVSATWGQSASDGDGPQAKLDRVIDADEEGRFAVCGVSVSRPLHLHATSNSGNADADVDWKGPVMAIVLVAR